MGRILRFRTKRRRELALEAFGTMDREAKVAQVADDLVKLWALGSDPEISRLMIGHRDAIEAEDFINRMRQQMGEEDYTEAVQLAAGSYHEQLMQGH